MSGPRFSTRPGVPGILAVLVQLAVPVVLVAIVTATTRARPVPHAMLVVATTWFGVTLGAWLIRSFTPIPAATSPFTDAVVSWEDRLVEFAQVLRGRGMEEAGLALGGLLVAYRTHAIPSNADVDAVAALEGATFDDIAGHPPMADLVALFVVLHDRTARSGVVEVSEGVDPVGAS